MSELGQFLEAVCGPAVRFTSLKATIRQWTDRTLAATTDSPHRKPIGRSKPQQDVTEGLDEAILNVWLQGPDRVRIESTETREDDIESKLTIVAGDNWWARDNEGHVETHEGSSRRNGPSTTDTERHFDGDMLRNFLGGLSLEQVGTVEVAGRRCARLRAVPRPEGQIWPHWLPSDADEYEFHADPDHGVLLGILAISRGKPYDGSQVLEIAFDTPIDDKLFTYTPDPGEQVQPSAPVAEWLSLDAAIAKMPFKVLVPDPLPDAEQTHLQFIYHPSRKYSLRPHLMVRFDGCETIGRTWIYQAATPANDEDRYEWEPVRCDGIDMRLSDPQVEGGLKLLDFERHGTHVRIVTDLPRDELCDLAASLSPAGPQG